MTALSKSVHDAAEEIDAAIFSGDEFVLDDDRIARLREYMARWGRGLDEHEAGNKEMREEGE